ncbi:MAG: hypothetical protein IJG65_04265 [Synergistaceae bacterium]|nr:hypothetical protein [Synergistaceae bacterium]
MSISKISLVWDESKDFLKTLKVLLPYFDLVKVHCTFMDVKEDYCDPENWEAFCDEAHPEFNSKLGLSYVYEYFWSWFPIYKPMFISADYVNNGDDTIAIDKLLYLEYVYNFVLECLPDKEELLPEYEKIIDHTLSVLVTNLHIYHENQIKRNLEFMYKGNNSASMLYDMSEIYTKMLDDDSGLSDTCRAITADGITLPYYDVPFSELLSLRENVGVPKLPQFMSGFYPPEASRLAEFVASTVNPQIATFNEAVILGRSSYVQAMTKALGKPAGYARLFPTYFSGIKEHAAHVWRNEEYIPGYISRIPERRRKSPIHYRVSFSA